MSAPTAATVRAWADQIVADSIAWHRAVNKITDPALLAAYEVGARQVAAELISVLRLQGIIR